jgi:MFS transporter, UMF1 family
MSSDVALTVPKRQVFSWALWDWGTSAFSVLITTFVFARYIVSGFFIDPEVVEAYEAAGGADGATGEALANFTAAEAHLTSWVGWALAIGGLTIALVSPILGLRTDASGNRKVWLGINTGIMIGATAAMFFVEGSPSFFAMGIILLTIAERELQRHVAANLHPEEHRSPLGLRMGHGLHRWNRGTSDRSGRIYLG